MAGPGSITTKDFIGGLNLLFLLLFVPLTRGVVPYLSPPLADNNPPQKFNLSFDVEEYGDQRWEVAYRRLIDSLRTKLGSGSRWARLPVLHPQPPEGQDPTEWFHLVLKQGQDGTSITLRIRGDNLYVVGFRREGGDHTDHDDPWWECNDDKKLIKDSKPLGFSCNYNHIAGAAGLQALTEVGLGRHALRDAAAQLATVHLPDGDSPWTARSLLAVIIMVSEATRFREIADLFMVRVGPGERQYLTPRMDALLRGWADISQRIFRALQNPEHRPDTFPVTFRRGGTEVVLSTLYAAERLLGILLLPRNCPWLPPRPCILITLPPAQLEGGGATLHYCAQGRPLLEVISVIINDIDGEDPGKLYGTVRVTDALGPQSIYDRDRYSFENVSPGKAATLTGPADRAISALSTITIDLDLWDRGFSTAHDNQVSKGAIEWDHLAFAKRFDTRLSQTVTGTYGSATVHYVVFSDAVEAKFEVTLLQGNDGQHDQVYGRIVAWIGDLGIESVLFSTTSCDYSQVWYGNRIPLQRTTVAVPLSSYVRVSALLYDYDSSSAADEIASGSTNFGAKSSGTTKWRITGQSGEIEVKVTWNPSY